eukprot:TRINITY_DN3597_c0_g1_i2.p1 TRINITY_DN3597_c0_g1~~TRINITY_DN3597_c0_g1_i2.p1  ORF type:complete len:258 (+),score=43.27 TRINITY_DN3597_c0_g1_i2:90-863(+)
MLAFLVAIVSVATAEQAVAATATPWKTSTGTVWPTSWPTATATKWPSRTPMPMMPTQMPTQLPTPQSDSRKSTVSISFCCILSSSEQEAVRAAILASIASDFPAVNASVEFTTRDVEGRRREFREDDHDHDHVEVSVAVITAEGDVATVSAAVTNVTAALSDPSSALSRSVSTAAGGKTFAFGSSGAVPTYDDDDDDSNMLLLLLLLLLIPVIIIVIVGAIWWSRKQQAAGRQTIMATSAEKSVPAEDVAQVEMQKA